MIEPAPMKKSLGQMYWPNIQRKMIEKTKQDDDG
jgi:hypothetical protein